MRIFDIIVHNMKFSQQNLAKIITAFLVCIVLVEQ